MVLCGASSNVVVGLGASLFSNALASIQARKYLKKYSLKDTVDLIYQSEKMIETSIGLR